MDIALLTSAIESQLTGREELIGIWNDGNGRNETIEDDGALHINRGNLRISIDLSQEDIPGTTITRLERIIDNALAQ